MPAEALGVPEPDEDRLPIAFALDRRQPVGDQVYDALKRAIVTIRLLPRTPISENRICRSLDVSRTPVRLAIARLAEEGLIDVYPQQGSFVAPIRLGGIADSHFIRKALELAMLAEAAPRWSPAWSDAARAVVARQQAACAAGDDDLFHAEDEHFHQFFSVFARREGVWPTVLGAKARLGRFTRLFGNPDRLPMVVTEHLAILDALDRGAIAEAVRAYEYHVDRIFVLLEQVPERYRPYLAD